MNYSCNVCKHECKQKEACDKYERHPDAPYQPAITCEREWLSFWCHCGKEVKEFHKRCPKCGQLLDWEHVYGTRHV